MDGRVGGWAGRKGVSRPGLSGLELNAGWGENVARGERVWVSVLEEPAVGLVRIPVAGCYLRVCNGVCVCVHAGQARPG